MKEVHNLPHIIEVKPFGCYVGSANDTFEVLPSPFIRPTVAHPPPSLFILIYHFSNYVCSTWQFSYSLQN